MTARFGNRIARDLRQIANTVAPSDDAWASIRQRIERSAVPDPEVIMLKDDGSPRSRQQKTWGALAVAAAAAAVVLVVIFTWPSGDEEIGTAASTTPPQIAVIQGYLEASNDRDFDGVMEFFSEESTIINHPFGTAGGIEEIGALHRMDMSASHRSEPSTFDGLQLVDGVVTWDHRWVNNRNEAYCGSGHQAAVEDGKIIRWEFPPRDLCEGEPRP